MVVREEYSSAGSDKKVSAAALQEMFLKIVETRKLTRHQILPAVLYLGGIRNYFGTIKGINIESTSEEERVLGELEGVREMLPIIDALGAPYNFRAEITSNGSSFGFSVVGSAGKLENLDQDKHINFGLNFGYPRCCIDAFVSDRGNDGNGRFRRYREMQDRHAGETSYVLHIPCSGDCEPTLVQARRYRDFTRANFPLLAGYMETNRFGE